MKDLLLEIGVEELPARFVGPALRDLAAAAIHALENAGLAYKTVNTLGTPRRLALIVESLSDKAQDRSQEFLGPNLAQAKDPAGNWTPPALGFARSQGTTPEKLELRDTDRGTRLAFVKKTPGAPADKILPELLAGLVKSLAFPKSMVWEEGRTAFARPVRWLLALHGAKTVPFTIAGVKSGKKTWGLRFHSKKPFDVAAPAKYESLLRNRLVIVDPTERRGLIAEQIGQVVRPVHGHVPLADLEGLMDEVVNLVEHPVAILGSFDARHLALPVEVLVTTMKKHQKYFPVYKDAEAKTLLPHFVGVRNGLSDGQAVVREGYERVLSARLADAEFFFGQDRKRPLADRVADLAGVAFLSPKLSMKDKTDRVIALVDFLAEALKVPADEARRIALLAKADLTTGMVGEFPELQGVMGRLYAVADGEPAGVAQGVEQHHWPLTAEGTLPESPAGALVSLADKIDTLSGNFMIGKIPSGSQDPYGLRRAAIGILRILESRGWRLGFARAVDKALAALPDGLGDKAAGRKALLDFLSQRWSALAENQGFRVDTVRAVVAAGFDDPVEAAKRLAQVQAFRKQEGFDAVAGAVKRAKNILSQAEKKFGWKPAGDGYDTLPSEAEKDLAAAVGGAKARVDEALAKEDHRAILESFVALRGPVDKFFEGVMVMAPEEDLRRARLALLHDMVGLFRRLCDFSQLQDTPESKPSVKV